MAPDVLLAVPNFSEGRDLEKVAALGRALAGEGAAPGSRAGGEGGAPGAGMLDVHSDPDHDRSVFTLAAGAGPLADAVLRGAALAVSEIDVMGTAGRGKPQAGQHPHVGALDVAPVVYLEQRLRGAACAEALVIADRIGHELAVPVFLYGELTASAGEPARTRAELRRGGVAGLAGRIGTGPGRLAPDFGPPRMHASAGATLVAARPPLVAFNMRLAPPASLTDARTIAASIREGGGDGIPGVRAIGIHLEGRGAQVSVNVERPFEVALADVVAAVQRLVPIAACELVGLAPRAALEGFPEDLPIAGFDPARQVLENALCPDA